MQTEPPSPSALDPRTAEVAPRIHPPGARSLKWIAAYNLGKGLLLFTLALGFLGFLGKDVDVVVGNWLSSLGVSLENLHVVKLLARLDLITDNQLRVLSGVTFVLGGVFTTEGIGLFYKQRWAEYLTVIVTASFIPLEVFESFKHFGPAKLILIAVNGAIVWMLVRILRDGAKLHHI